MSLLRNITLCVALCACISAVAQPDRRDVRKGNRDFRKGDFREAEIDYRKALVKDSLSFAANYNLAATLYRNGDMDQARRHLDTLGGQAPASRYASDYYYNYGNVAVGQKDWQAAVESYMKSLIINPDDLEAKENFIYAKEMLRNQQQNGGGDGQDDKDNQDQDQDKDGNGNNDQNQDRNQDQDKNKNDEGNDGRDDRNDQGQGDDRGQEQPKISPQAAQQMLQAIQAKEKETQEKVNKEKAEAMKSRQKEKNW